IKVAGGKTGSHCKNLAIPPGQPQPKPQIVGPVLDVRSLSSVRIPVTINATANANVNANWNCPAGTLSGSAYGMGSIHSTLLFTISQRLLLGDHGRTNGSVKDYIRQQIQTQVEANAKANALAKITITCGSAPPPQVCTDHNASNYGGALPCQYPPAKCTDTSATNYGGPLPCTYPPAKCTDTRATNYGGPLPCQYPPVNQPPTGDVLPPKHIYETTNL